LVRISFSGDSGATSDANVDGHDTWRTPDRWIEAQETAGSFWKSEEAGAGETWSVVI
jgi:hypothetical protein